MSDLIKREDVMQVAFLYPFFSDALMEEIKAIPSADRPQGEWIDKGWKGDWQFETDGRGNCWHEYECSECGFRNKGSKSKFCPDCGRRMKGADNE